MSSVPSRPTSMDLFRYIHCSDTTALPKDHRVGNNLLSLMAMGRMIEIFQKSFQENEVPN